MGFYFLGFITLLNCKRALPVIAGLSAFLHPNFCSKLVNFVVHLGIPLTGIGITATQFGFPLWIETGAALCMTLGGLMTAALLLHIYLENKSKWFLAAGILLLMTMLLSGNYALRWFMPHLDIAWMRVLHGSINAFFFSTIALMGLIKAPMIQNGKSCQLR